jgi:hypothetical protein
MNYLEYDFLINMVFDHSVRAHAAEARDGVLNNVSALLLRLPSLE